MTTPIAPYVCAKDSDKNVLTSTATDTYCITFSKGLVTMWVQMYGHSANSLVHTGRVSGASDIHGNLTWL